MQIPLTNPYPGPRSVLVFDNCNIHHAEEIRSLIEEEARKYMFSITLLFYIYQYIFSLVCRLVFLPPYSPDYNPIESAFSSIKAYLRRHHTEEGLQVISDGCLRITAGMAKGWFHSSGYV